MKLGDALTILLALACLGATAEAARKVRKYLLFKLFMLTIGHTVKSQGQRKLVYVSFLVPNITRKQKYTVYNCSQCNEGE